MEGLGGHALCNIGLADDQHDLGADAVVEPWLENFWSVVNSLYPPPTEMVMEEKPSFPPSR